MIQPRYVLRGSLRLSLLLALMAGVYTSFQDWTANAEKYQDQQEMLRTIECGAKLSDDRLHSASNDFGNIDLGKVGCANRQFWANPKEIDEARAGTMRQMSWLLSGPSINPLSTMYSALGAFLLVNALGIAFLIVRAVALWVFDGFKARS